MDPEYDAYMRERDKCPSLPTPKTIARRTAIIRAAWSPRERACRLVGSGGRDGRVKVDVGIHRYKNRGTRVDRREFFT